MWSGVLSHRVICWCGKSLHSSKFAWPCCGTGDMPQMPLSAPGLLGGGAVLWYPLVLSVLHCLFLLLMWCVCVCFFLLNVILWQAYFFFFWKVRLCMRVHKNKLTLTMCPLDLTWFVSIHTHGSHGSGNPLLPPPPPPFIPPLPSPQVVAVPDMV